jgi:arylsulfatase A-like enzyme
MVIGVLLLSIIVHMFPDQPQVSSLSITGTSDTKQLPNILLITSDGVNADHMSVYGYERDTTPRLRQLAQSALVAENAFPNSGRSAGSIVSLYTGKYPAETHLLSTPDILKGDDSFEHLPGILHSLGYRTVQVTTPYYLDAITLNIAEGFDEVKMLNGAVHSKYLSAMSKVLPNDKALFTDEVVNRIIDRIKHIFFIQKMVNPYLLVAEMAEPLLDLERLEIIKYEMRTSGQPVFIHVHLMGTHPPRYIVTEQKFSAGQSIDAQPPLTDDFYDDSILAFDKNTGELIDYLTELDLLDDTVLIIGSDHGQQWDLVKRLPLMIRFPHGEYAGKIQANVQNLDIAPTVLDYIGFEQPGWMRGNSLIAGELEQRLIYGMTISRPKGLNINDSLFNEESAASLSDHSFLNTLIHCDKWFLVDSYNLVWETGYVESSTATCPPSSTITDEQAFQSIIEHLKANGFDVSNLTQLSP